MNTEPKNREELLVRIQLLEAQRQSQLIELENEAQELMNSLNPLNLIKSSVQKASTFENIVDLLKGSLLGAGSGFVARQIFGKQEGHALRRMLGSAAILGLTNLALKNPSVISGGLGFVMDLIKKFRGNTNEKASGNPNQPD